MTKYNENISNQYPIITLIRMLTIFDYRSGFIRNWTGNKEKLTIHQIGHIMGLNGREMNQVIDVLEPMGLISEYKTKKKRYLIVEDIIINAIAEGKEIKMVLLNIDKNINQEFNM